MLAMLANQWTRLRAAIGEAFFVENGLHFCDAGELGTEFCADLADAFAERRDVGEQPGIFGFQSFMLDPGDISRRHWRDARSMRPSFALFQARLCLSTTCN